MRNEEKWIEKTIHSVINQSIIPAEWIIVNDGSTDQSECIVSRYSKNYDWIKLINLNTSQEKRSGGQRIVRAFYHGLNTISVIDYDYIVKLDADISFNNKYFSRIFDEFNYNKNLGVCGGVIYNRTHNGSFVKEKSAPYHVRGAFKCYRRKCFQDIGGFKEIWNWDGIDIMETLFLGWESKQIDEKVYHYRKTTSSYNLFHHSFKSGYEYYRTGSTLLLMIIRSLVRLHRRPIILRAMLLFTGYLVAVVTRPSKVITDQNLIKFINKFHFKRMLNYLKLVK
jgi:glycosyltransferase involved in cell wall biosynthesis